MHDPEVSLPIGAVTVQNTLALHGKSSPAGYHVVCARLMHDPEDADGEYYTTEVEPPKNMSMRDCCALLFDLLLSL